jgi:TonB-linked SusC/RagA family outer membrane protein
MKDFTGKLLLGLLTIGISYSSLIAQDRVVTGVIRDASDGSLLPGVNILIKSTNKGTTSDAQGAFKITISGNDDILLFSFIGYKTQEISVGSRSVIDLTLESDVFALSEVVVVGYGTQKKADITGAVGGIRADDIGMSSKAITSADQVLAGRLAGVNVTNRSGDPGAPINVRIRGVGTTGSNSPLWVIDGVPIVQTSNITVNTASITESNPLAGINPNDIESIDVLKDASAAAIYGSRAANGVILVTTKRGKAGKAILTYDGYLGVGQVRKQLDVLNVKEYVNIQGQLGRDFSAFANEPTVDWQDAVFKSASIESHNVSISGGSENATYSIGGSYMNQEGIEQAQSFKRYSVKANTDVKVGDRLKFGETMLLSFVDRSVQSEDAVSAIATYSSSAANAAANSPYFKIHDDPANGIVGPYGYNPENTTTLGPAGYGINLLMRTDPRVAETSIETNKVLGNIYGELKIIEGLTYRISGGLDYNQGGGDYYSAAVATDGSYVRTSFLIQERAVEKTYNFSNTLTYTKSFGDHHLTLLAGHDETTFMYEKSRIQGTDLLNPSIRLPTVAKNVAASNEADHWALRGFLGRINYAFKDRYLLTVNLRNDITSRFSKENRSQLFPSVSAGWRISEESFFPKESFISDFKIRAAWGQSGNQFTGVNFAYLSTLPTTIYYVTGTGQTVVRGAAPVTMANPNLKWETSTQMDFGADLTLLQGRIDLTIDYYNKITNDVLLPLPVPMSSGFFLAVDANGGKILNRGIELSATYNQAIGKLKYSIGGNITTVHNEVLELNGITDIITGVGGAQTHRTEVGEPLGYFYGYQTQGIFQNQTEVDHAVPDALSSGRAPGDIRFKDVNGDNVVDDRDRTKLGSSIPGFYYGINVSASYKRFDFSLLLQGVGDVQVYNAARANLENLAYNNNFTKRALDHWDGEGTSSTIPRLTPDDPNGNNRYSSRWIEDADFMRIKNIQISYAIPSDKWSKGFVSRLRVYVAIQNLATFTKYLGYDPEVTRGFSFQKGDMSLANGQDSGNSPQPRFFQFGWQLSF